jgi:hypothetical protein
MDPWAPDRLAPPEQIHRQIRQESSDLLSVNASHRLDGLHHNTTRAND